MSSVLNGIYQTEAVTEALDEAGRFLSAVGSRPIRLTLSNVVPLDAQSDIGHIIPTMTRICGAVRMPFCGDVCGVSQVMFTEKISLFFYHMLAEERWTAPHNRYVEMDVALEAGHCLLAPLWAVLINKNGVGSGFRFDTPLAEWGAVECLLESVFHHAVARAYVITCDCDGDYVDELIIVQAGSPASSLEKP